MDVYAEKHQDFMAHGTQRRDLSMSSSKRRIRCGRLRFWEASQKKGYTKATKKLQPQDGQVRVSVQWS